MKGVLNETTNTIHKHETGKTKLATECGITYHVAAEQLRVAPIEQATADPGTRKCGRCFDDAGGY